MNSPTKYANLPGAVFLSGSADAVPNAGDRRYWPIDATLPLAVIQALRFYANGDHLIIDEQQDFDTCSGEPQNWLMSQKDDDTTMLEDGTIARVALLGGGLDWKDGDEDTQSKPIPGEAYTAAMRQAHTFDFHAHLARQRAFSDKTFGPGPRTAGVLDHIRKELTEIEAAPFDLSEWIDVVILALDGAGRAGHSPDQIIAALVAKQEKNEARTWPDWRTVPLDRAIEHVRTGPA